MADNETGFNDDVTADRNSRMNSEMYRAANRNCGKTNKGSA